MPDRWTRNKFCPPVDGRVCIRRKQRASLAKLKKLNREIKKLERATHLKPAVALFGPSQAGKSFMVGLLAKSSSDEVMYVADDATGKMYDFTDQINPPGGKESTGLVTRFTVSDTWDNRRISRLW